MMMIPADYTLMQQGQAGYRDLEVEATVRVTYPNWR